MNTNDGLYYKALYAEAIDTWQAERDALSAYCEMLELGEEAAKRGSVNLGGRGPEISSGETETGLIVDV